MMEIEFGITVTNYLLLKHLVGWKELNPRPQKSFTEEVS